MFKYHVLLIMRLKTELKSTLSKLCEYSRAAEPPVRCGESHMSGLTGATLLH